MTIDYYTATLDRMEPEVAPVDPGAFYASAAISLKRIADSLDREATLEQIGLAAAVMAERAGRETGFGLTMVDALAKAGFKVVPKI